MKAFTLIELLVVVAIIGILAAVGVTTFNGFQLSAKKSATIQQWKTVSKFIQYQLKMCDIDGGTLQLSPTRSINCDVVNNKAGVNSVADAFMNHFLDLAGFLPPFSSLAPILTFSYFYLIAASSDYIP